jgi:hypothetical protein
MGRIDLDAGESRKIIAESVDAVEEFVEAVSGEIFLSEQSTVPSESADPIPEGDRTDVTARQGTPVYVKADPRGDGATVRVGNAQNGINVSRPTRRGVARPPDVEAERNGVRTEDITSSVTSGLSLSETLTKDGTELYTQFGMRFTQTNLPSDYDNVAFRLNTQDNQGNSQDVTFPASSSFPVGFNPPAVAGDGQSTTLDIFNDDTNDVEIEWTLRYYEL